MDMFTVPSYENMVGTVLPNIRIKRKCITGRPWHHIHRCDIMSVFRSTNTDIRLCCSLHLYSLSRVTDSSSTRNCLFTVTERSFTRNCLQEVQLYTIRQLNPLNPELNPICYLLALLGAYHFLHVSWIRVKSLTLRLLMSYIYIWSTYSWCF